MNSGKLDSDKIARLWKLRTSADELVLEGKRDLDVYLQLLQGFVFGSDLGVELWLEVYKALGMEAEFIQAMETLVLPKKQGIWSVPMVKGITINRIVVAHRSLGVNYYLYTEDLDSAVPTHDRDANRDGSYVVGCRRNVEADEEFAGKSANDLAVAGHKGFCLPERLLLGFAYNMATGQHLDVKNITLCTGSRDRGGGVPRVGWDAGGRRVYVGWYSPAGACGILRSRSVVSS